MSSNVTFLYKGLKSSLRQFVEDRYLTINFNWATVLFFSYFVAYGYYGALTPEYGQLKANLIASTIKLAFLTLILVLLGLLAWKASGRFKDSIKIQRKDIFVFLSYFVIFFSFSFGQLQFSLFSDEISYSGTSHGHSVYISLFLAKQINVLDGAPFRYLVQITSLILLISLSSLFVLSKRLTWINKIIIFSLLLVFCRLVFSVAGGNSSPHPPLQLIPPFIFGSLFGITDFSFKLSYFTVYVIFILMLYRMMHRVFTFSISYLLALAIGTIPLLWHLAAVVEHSLWASIGFTLVLVEIITSTKLSYIRLTSFISIAALMRQPSFLAIFPVLMLFIAEEFQSRDRGNWLPKLFFLLSPTLLFIPFVGSSLIHGTPSTEALSESSTLGRVLGAIDSGIIWTSISNSVPYWWIILILFSFIPLSRKMAGRNIIIFIFFAITIYVYYSINTSLWGYAKYQAEYAVPFAISGMLFLAIKLSTLNYSRHILAALISVMIFLNIADFVRIPQGNKPIDVLAETMSDDSKKPDSGYHLLSAFPYNYRDAYDAIKNENLTESSYSIGATYGIFPEIMNGYSVKAVRAVHDIFIKQEPNRLNAQNEGWDVDFVESDSRIKVVLFGAVTNKQKLIDQFKARGWNVMGEYKNIKYGSTVVVMKKPVKVESGTYF